MPLPVLYQHFPGCYTPFMRSINENRLANWITRVFVLTFLSTMGFTLPAKSQERPTFSVLAIELSGYSDKYHPPIVISDSNAGAEWYLGTVLERRDPLEIPFHNYSVDTSWMVNLVADAESFQDIANREQTGKATPPLSILITLKTIQGQKSFVFNIESGNSLLDILKRHCKDNKDLQSDLSGLQERILQFARYYPEIAKGYTALVIEHSGDLAQDIFPIALTDSDAGTWWYRVTVLKRRDADETFPNNYAVNTALLKKLIADAESFRDTAKKEQNQELVPAMTISITVITPQARTSYLLNLKSGASLVRVLKDHSKDNEYLHRDLRNYQKRLVQFARLYPEAVKGYTALAIEYIGMRDHPVFPILISDSKVGAEWHHTFVLNEFDFITNPHVVSVPLMAKLVADANSFREIAKGEQDQKKYLDLTVSITVVTPQGKSTYLLSTKSWIPLFETLKTHCKNNKAIQADLEEFHGWVLQYAPAKKE